MDAILDFVGDMGDDLHRFAQVIAAPFLIEDRLVDLPAGQVVEAGELGVSEAFIMAQIEVSLRAVVQTNYNSVGVDLPEDVARVEKAMRT